MQQFKTFSVTTAIALTAVAGIALAENKEPVADSVIMDQRAVLANSTAGAGFGPQSPRDIDAVDGKNDRAFEAAPAFTSMNLCNIHFHEGAEHKGGEFTKYAGNGDGKGYGTGYLYSGELTAEELKPVDYKVGAEKHGTLEPGDTIEVHYVHTSAKVEPGPTLGSCLSDAIKNPQLRVEALVVVLVNDDSALDFKKLNNVSFVNGYYQAPNIPDNMGTPVQYAGSTTGPGYNEAGSPFQVSWSVRPKVAKVSIKSVADWLGGNEFDEDHAHGVRNLVRNPLLLARIKK
ncbi:MAG: delta-class carbonic anhydrase [Rhizobiaceae bacterium]|nr:delta-class carbonic anhydrase [Rhizobiaceae bacterium]